MLNEQPGTTAPCAQRSDQGLLAADSATPAPQSDLWRRGTSGGGVRCSTHGHEDTLGRIALSQAPTTGAAVPRLCRPCCGRASARRGAAPLQPAVFHHWRDEQMHAQVLAQSTHPPTVDVHLAARWMQGLTPEQRARFRRIDELRFTMEVPYRIHQRLQDFGPSAVSSTYRLCSPTGHGPGRYVCTHTRGRACARTYVLRLCE